MSGGLIPKPVIERILAKTEILAGPLDSPCWISLHGKTRGRPTVWVGSLTDGTRAPAYVHRVAYEHYVGPIPVGHEVHHECETKACWNPDHLQALTPAERASGSMIDPATAGSGP